jgi:hypothetical protein
LRREGEYLCTIFKKPKCLSPTRRGIRGEVLAKDSISELTPWPPLLRREGEYSCTIFKKPKCSSHFMEGLGARSSLKDSQILVYTPFFSVCELI